MTQPNFRLMREAYAIIGGIPDEKFNLSDIVKEQADPKNIQCGTIACAAGWLGMHPKIQRIGNLETTRFSMRDRATGDYLEYDKAMARVFRMPHEDADALFAPRGCGYLGVLEEHHFDGSDKQLWLERVRQYLKKRGELSAQVRARGGRP